LTGFGWGSSPRSQTSGRRRAADPGSAAAHFYLAYTKYKMVEKKKPFHPGKQEAAAEFAKAYELDPTFQPIWHMKR